MSNTIPKISIAIGENSSTLGSISDLPTTGCPHLLRKRHSPLTSSTTQEAGLSSESASSSKLRKISTSDFKAGIPIADSGGENTEAQKPGTSRAAAVVGERAADGVDAHHATSTTGGGRRNSQLKYLTDYFPNQQSTGEFRLTRSRAKAKQTFTQSSVQRSLIPVSKEKHVKRNSPHRPQQVNAPNCHGKALAETRAAQSTSLVVAAASNPATFSHPSSSFAQSQPQHFELTDSTGLSPGFLSAMTPTVIMNMPSAADRRTVPIGLLVNEPASFVPADVSTVGGPVDYATQALNYYATGNERVAAAATVDGDGGAGRKNAFDATVPSSSAPRLTSSSTIGINRSSIPVSSYSASGGSADGTTSKPSSSMFGARSHHHISRATTFLGNLVPRMQHLLSSSNAGANSNVALSSLAGSGAGSIHFYHSSSRITSIVEGLRSMNEIRQSEAASELAEMLLLGNEESLPNMPVCDIIQCLIALLQKDHNFELMLTAARCITNMQEALPRALPLITETIPLLLQKLKRIEYIDVAEQSLIALEVMSRRNARNILTAGGIAATISHVDFFSLPSQRLAFQIAANCGVYVTPAEFALVKDCLNDLTQRLSFVDDKRCIESICTFFNRLIENMRNHPDRLREIAGVNFDFLKGVQQLLMVQPSTLGSNTFFSLLKSARYMCNRCGDIAVALINMDFGRTLRYLLMGHEKVEEVSFDISSRSPQQLKEIIELIGELMSNLPNTEVSEITMLLDHYMNIGSAYSSYNVMRLQYPFDVLSVNWYLMDEEDAEWQLLGAEETTLLENAKSNGEQLTILELENGIFEVDFVRMIYRNTVTGVERNLDRRLSSVAKSADSAAVHDVDERNVLKRSNNKTFLELIRLLCPILVEIGTSSTCSSLRFETLKVMVRMIYAVESETQLRKVLANVPLAIYIASTLSSNRNIGVVVSAIQLVHILLEKIPHLYVPLLEAEGVLHEIEKIAKSKKKSLFSSGTKIRSARHAQAIAVGSAVSSSSAVAEQVASVPASSSAFTTEPAVPGHLSDLSLSSYLAAAAAMVNATAPNVVNPTSLSIVSQYTQQLQQQIQRQQHQLQSVTVGYVPSVRPSHLTVQQPAVGVIDPTAVEPVSHHASRSHTTAAQQQTVASQPAGGSHRAHYSHHQHVTTADGHRSGSATHSLAPSGSVLMAGHQLVAAQQQQQYRASIISSASSSSSSSAAAAVAAIQQQQQFQVNTAAQNLLGASGAASNAPFLASVISSSVGSFPMTPSDASIARAHAAFSGLLTGQAAAASSGSTPSILSSQQLGTNNVQTLTSTSNASSIPLPLHHSVSSSQAALKQSILERLQKYIQAEAEKLLAKYAGDKSSKYGIKTTANSVLAQLSKIAKLLVIQGRDVGCEPLVTLSQILADSEISAFQLNHSGIISALNVYLTDNSEKMSPPRKLRLRRFAVVFMKMAADNLNHTLPGSPELVSFERLVNKLVLAIGQLEQFHVRITNLSGVIHSGSLSAASSGGSATVLSANALASTTYLRGAQALRFFQSHQIRCNLKRHPTCKQLREWRHGRGSIKVDPFTSISAIERYLLDRGIGLASTQMDNSSDNDDISDEEQDLSYSSGISYSGRIELYIGENRIPSDMSILQAIRQFAVPYDDEAQETIPSSIWLAAHTLYYKVAEMPNASESASSNSMSNFPLASSSSVSAAGSSVIRSVGSTTNATSFSAIAGPSGSGSKRHHYYRSHQTTSAADSNKADTTEATAADTTTSSSKTAMSARKNLCRLSNRSADMASFTTVKKAKYSANITKDSRVFKNGEIPKRTPPHLRYLSGTLDEPITDPSLDCLVLLKTLYGLNTYWWAIFDEEMPPPSYASILPNHVFYCPKLNSKVSRQLSDFLSVATQQIPKWTTNIVKAVPFAFPFVTRRNLLYCTAFGRDRALMHLVNESTSDEHDGDSTSRLIPRLERKKVSINRNNLMKDAQQIFAQMGGSKAMLEVGFDGEVGTGFGPTLEFYSTLSREFQKFDLKLWDGKAQKSGESDESAETTEYVLSENGLYPFIYRPSSSRQMDARIKKFEFFGRLLAQSLMDSRILDIPIAATFFKWLIGEEENFGIEDLELLEPVMYKSLQRLVELDEDDFTDLETYFTFPGENTFEMIKGGKNIQLTKENLKQFIELVSYWRLVEGVRPEMEAVRRGIQSVINIDALRIFFAHEIEQLFCGCPENGDEKIWSTTALQQALRPDHGFTYESIQIVWLVEMLNTFSNEKRRKFLQFVTGSPRLPVGGFRALSPPLTVVRKTTSCGSSQQELPSAMTCYNYLKIPPYESYEIFVERFDVALQFIYSFHLT